MARRILDDVHDRVADEVTAWVTDLDTGEAIDPDAPPADREFRVAMTYEAWLAWPPAESRVSEWCDGEVTVFVPGSELHQDIVLFVSILLSWYARAENLGKIIVAPFEMRVSARRRREPDIVFVAREHADRLDGKRLNGAADLAIEIVSPDSVTRDRRHKLAEYARLGIPEYWILDARPGRSGSEFYHLTPDGRYQPAFPDADGRYHAATLPGFWFRPAWLWQEPMPDPVALLPTIAPEAWRRTLAAIEST